MLAAGQLTFGFICSSRALSFLAPQEGNLFRSARTSFSISADVAYGELCGVRVRSSSPSGPTPGGPQSVQLLLQLGTMGGSANLVSVVSCHQLTASPAHT